MCPVFGENTPGKQRASRVGCPPFRALLSRPSFLCIRLNFVAARTLLLTFCLPVHRSPQPLSTRAEWSTPVTHLHSTERKNGARTEERAALPTVAEDKPVTRTKHSLCSAARACLHAALRSRRQRCAALPRHTNTHTTPRQRQPQRAPLPHRQQRQQRVSPTANRRPHSNTRKTRATHRCSRTSISSRRRRRRRTGHRSSSSRAVVEAQNRSTT